MKTLFEIYDSLRPKSVFNLNILPRGKNSIFYKVMLKSKVVGNIKTNIYGCKHFWFALYILSGLIDKRRFLKANICTNFFLLFSTRLIDERCVNSLNWYYCVIIDMYQIFVYLNVFNGFDKLNCMCIDICNIYLMVVLSLIL